MSLITNTHLAVLFRQMADAYRFLGKEQRFRALAYARAATELTNMQDSVEQFRSDRKALIDLKNIGESIADKIIEYLNTGKIEAWELLKKQVPIDLLPLLQAEGIGPSTIRLLHAHWGIVTKRGLLEKMNARESEPIPGIGPKKWRLIRQALQSESISDKRHPLNVAEPLAKKISAEILSLSGVQACTLAGSLRRKKSTIGDIDLVVVVDTPLVKSIYQKLSVLPAVSTVFQKGSRKMQFQLKEIPIRVDVRFVEKSEYGSALLYFTGPVEHNLAMRKSAISFGWKLNEYGLFDRESLRRIAGETERSIYQSLKLPYIDPKFRTGLLPLASASLKKRTNVMAAV